MYYCEHCQRVFPERECPVCGNRQVRQVRDEDYCVLTQMEEMWGKLLLEILEDNGTAPVSWGAVEPALALRGGVSRRIYICVPFRHLERAKALMEETVPQPF